MLQIQFIRNASFILSTDNVRILVDPVFAKKWTQAALPFSNWVKNPTSELEHEISIYLDSIDAVFITHFHDDHFDQEAINLIDKK